MELKIVTLIFVAATTNVLAEFSYSQITTASLDMENTSLENVIDEIEMQSESNFTLNQKQVDVSGVIDVRGDNSLITDIFPDLYSGNDVNFKVPDRKIQLTIDPLESNLRSGVSKNNLQQKQITGTVTDENNNPLPGVTVLVKGTSIGTLTDVSGKYSISNAPQEAILVFSFIGMTTQEIPMGNRMVIDVIMKEEAIG
jgi:hypothetical protein